MPSIEEQLAWAAGLFEGEGWFTRQTDGGSPIAAIRSTDRDTIERFGEIMGSSVRIYSVDKGAGNKTQWHWQISGYEKVRRFGDLIGPWLLSRRREQLERVLGHSPPAIVHLHERQLRIAEG